MGSGNAATDAANDAASDAAIFGDEAAKFGDFTADKKSHREKQGARGAYRSARRTNWSLRGRDPRFEEAKFGACDLDHRSPEKRRLPSSRSGRGRERPKKPDRAMRSYAVHRAIGRRAFGWEGTS